MTVTRIGSTIRLLVSDTGPGIAAADAERIFERFVRLDASPNGSGGGLGLPIARWIAHAHGGSLTVASTDAGGGCFAVTLPLTI